MRIDSTLSPWSEINRAWNLLDRYWPARDYELVSATFPIDMYQQDGKVVVRASIPGVKPQDLTVNLEQNILTITGESYDTFEEGKNSRMFHREHSYGKFLRTIRLPSGIDENKIDAELNNGILIVSVPLSMQESTQPRRIPVHTVDASHKPIEAHTGGDRQKEPASHTNSEREKVSR